MPGSATAALAFDDLPDGLIVADSTGEIQLMNAAFASMLDREADSVLGLPLQDIVADEDMLCLVGFRAVFETGPLHDAHVIFTTPDGRRRPLLISACTARNGSSVLITARGAGTAQRELADASRWVVREQERALSLVEARDELSAKNDALRAAQGHLEDAYDKLKHEMVKREHLQQELNLARRLEAIGQLSAGVAHEINTPLQYVGDSVHFLGKSFQLLARYLERIEQLTGSEAAPPWTEVLTAIARARKEARLQFVIGEIPRAVLAAKQGIEHVSHIVQALKTFAHRGTDEKSPGDINTALRTTLLMAQNEYKDVATVQTQLGELPPVVCVIGQLNQVFLHLILNATHAIADARRERPGVITVTSLARDDFVEIVIGDDGCGIPEDLRHRVFEQFFTTKEVGRGTGQGLSLAHQIVVAGHGGTLAFESEVGKGTAFTVRLPIDGEPRLEPSKG